MLPSQEDQLAVYRMRALSSARIVKMWALILLFASMLALGFSAVTGRWLSAVFYGLYTIVASIGVQAAQKAEVKTAKVYFFGIILIILIEVVTGVVNYATTGDSGSIPPQMSGYGYNASDFQIFSIVGTVLVPLLCCGPCAWCAHSLRTNLEDVISAGGQPIPLVAAAPVGMAGTMVDGYGHGYGHNQRGTMMVNPNLNHVATPMYEAMVAPAQVGAAPTPVYGVPVAMEPVVVSSTNAKSVF